MKRIFNGRVFEVPEPGAHGTMQDLTRWIVIRDGLGEVLRVLPLGERALGNRLGECWAHAEGRVLVLRGVGGEWPSLF